MYKPKTPKKSARPKSGPPAPQPAQPAVVKIPDAPADTRIVNIFRAQAIAGEVEPVLIQITEELPQFDRDNPLELLAARYSSQAISLANALEASLPGGTMDALLREMLKRRASLLVVPQR